MSDCAAPNTNYLETFAALQIELSTVCNSLCLGCVRTDSTFNSTKTLIPQGQYLDIQIVIDLLNSQQGQKIRRIEFCGNIDEPLAHPDFLTLIDHLYELRPSLIIQVHTNGSIRNKSYHYDLSKKIKAFHEQSCLRYGIDGLADTHAIYRQNTSFKKAMENMKAAIDGGGQVIWQFLIFPWNRHQVEDAKELAKSIGCSEIWLRPDRSEATQLGLEQIQLQKKKPAPVKPPLGDFSMTAFIPRNKEDKILCKFLANQEGTMFLSWEAKIWPCCFHSNVLYSNESTRRAYQNFVLEGYDRDFNDLKVYSFDEICSHPFFQKDLMKSWQDPDSTRSWRCVQKCRSTKTRSSDNELDHINDGGKQKIAWEQR